MVQVFCLSPVGWAHWTPRFFEAIQAGCVPVLFQSADEAANVLPFERSIDYASFVVFVPPSGVPSLRQTLRSIVTSGLRKRQRALWHHRSLLDWTDLGERGAFRTLWSELSARRRARATAQSVGHHDESTLPRSR